jgi:hypothetical protein
MLHAYYVEKLSRLNPDARRTISMAAKFLTHSALPLDRKGCFGNSEQTELA